MAFQVNGGGIFSTLAEAKAEADAYFTQGGVIVAIEEV